MWRAPHAADRLLRLLLGVLPVRGRAALHGWWARGAAAIWPLRSARLFWGGGSSRPWRRQRARILRLCPPRVVCRAVRAGGAGGLGGLHPISPIASRRAPVGTRSTMRDGWNAPARTRCSAICSPPAPRPPLTPLTVHGALFAARAGRVARVWRAPSDPRVAGFVLANLKQPRLLASASATRRAMRALC
jgi:hypothetical protein